MNIAICDDDNVQLSILEEALHGCNRLDGKISNIDKFANGSDLLNAVKGGKQYEYIFLDIEMPEKSGFDIYDEIASESTAIVFVSTHFERLPEAFGYRPYGFLPKPYDQDMFDRTVISAENQKTRIQYYECVVDGKKHKIPCREIVYIAADNHDLLIFTSKDMYVVHRTSMNKVDQQMEKQDFFRCNRAHLVNLRYCIGRKGSIVIIEPNCSAEEIVIAKRRLAAFDDRVFKYKMGARHGF